MDRTCTIEGCSRPLYAKGLCSADYQKARYHNALPSPEAPTRPCARCGQSMVERKYAHAKYCSRECKEAATDARRKDAWEQHRLTRRCVWCDEKIPETAGGKAKTCSRACGVAWQNSKRAAIRAAEKRATREPCEGCGEDISGERHGGAKFCSDQCKRRVYAVRWRKKSPGYMRSYLYGLSDTEYVALLAAQQDACAICHTQDWGGKHGTPHVDHCHTAGKVRGLLCDACNNGLGRFRDDPERLRRAIEYLTKT